MISREKLDLFYKNNIDTDGITQEEFEIYRKVANSYRKEDVYFELENDLLDELVDTDLDIISKHLLDIVSDIDDIVDEYGFSSETVKEVIRNYIKAVKENENN